LKKAVLLDVDHVSKSFILSKQRQSELILEAVSLQVQTHQFISIIGSSGVGKSTLLRMIAGIIQPSYGAITFDGNLVTAPNRRMSMVFQNFALFTWLTVRQNIMFGLESQLNSDCQYVDNQIDNLINLIGLKGLKNAYPYELSGGMKQRVGFARALAVEPELLLLDEPFSALDVLTGQRLGQDLITLWERRKFKMQAIVLITHNISEAVRLSDVIYVLGGKPAQIMNTYQIKTPRNQRTEQQIWAKTMAITDQFKRDMNEMRGD